MAVETSGSIGIIIGVIIGVIIALVLALVFMRRRRRLNNDKAPKGGQATKAFMAEAQKAESERDENLISSTGSRSLFASSVKLTHEDRTSVRLRQPTNVRRSHPDLLDDERIPKMGPGRTRTRTHGTIAGQ